MKKYIKPETLVMFVETASLMEVSAKLGGDIDGNSLDGFTQNARRRGYIFDDWED